MTTVITNIRVERKVFVTFAYGYAADDTDMNNTKKSITKFIDELFENQQLPIINNLKNTTHDLSSLL